MPGICSKCLSMVKTLRLCPNARVPMATSVRGRLIPFFLKDDAILPAFIQSSVVISRVFIAAISLKIISSSFGFLMPCNNSAIIMPVVIAEFFSRRLYISALLPVSFYSDILNRARVISPQSRCIPEWLKGLGRDNSIRTGR